MVTNYGLSHNLYVKKSIEKKGIFVYVGVKCTVNIYIYSYDEHTYIHILRKVLILVSREYLLLQFFLYIKCDKYIHTMCCVKV